MDVVRFQEWMLSEFEPRPLRKATVDDTMRKLRALQRVGFDVDRFTADPQARECAAATLAVQARKEGNSLRCSQVVLNRVVAFMARQDPRWKVVKYRLAPEAKSTRPTQEEHQVRALEAVRGRDRYETVLWRALIWSVRATRLRRGEHSRMTVKDWRRDYDRAFGAVLVPLPGKRGHPRAIPVPEAAWDPSGPLQTYLRLRRRDMHRPEALWVRRDGLEWRALSPSDMTVLMNSLSDAVGFRVSFNRLRRFEFTRLKKAKVAPWTMLYLHGGSNYRVLEHYLGNLTPDEAHADLMQHVPEFAQGDVRMAANSTDLPDWLHDAVGAGAPDVQGAHVRVRAIGHGGSTQ